MKKIELAKTIVNIAVGLGTAKITYAIIANNVEPETTTDKVTVAAGSAALSGVAVDATSKYTDAKIDSWTQAWTERRSKKDVPNITEL